MGPSAFVVSLVSVLVTCVLGLVVTVWKLDGYLSDYRQKEGMDHVTHKQILDTQMAAQARVDALHDEHNILQRRVEAQALQVNSVEASVKTTANDIANMNRGMESMRELMQGMAVNIAKLSGGLS